MKQKQKQKWQIDDLVYFLGETSTNGDFPNMLMGTVEEIRRDSVRIKITYKDATNLLWVDSDKVFASAEDLRGAIRAHLAKQAYICDNPDEVSR